MLSPNVLIQVHGVKAQSDLLLSIWFFFDIADNRVNLIGRLCHVCDDVVCDHLIQFIPFYTISCSGNLWTGTERGGWTTDLGLSIIWTWYLSSGNMPILSKQSLYSSNTVDFERLITKAPGFSWGRAWGVQCSWMFKVVMIIIIIITIIIIILI